tara:strand:- start:77 stop:1075 length:999 start_codon:yes stop_codon:yes gene_type:complete
LISFLFIKSWHYDNILAEKNNQILNLRKANSSFEGEINSLNSYLTKIGGYFNAISDYEHVKNKNHIPQLSNLTIDKLKGAFNFVELNNKGKKMFNEVIEAKILQSNISKSVQSRINKLEGTLLLTGIDFSDGHIEKEDSDLDNSNVVFLSQNNTNKTPKGGPIEDDRVNTKNNFPSDVFKINNKVRYLNDLETVLNYLPISKPMSNYYISSNFGHRIDPFTKQKTMHRGTDFVGSSLNEDIISPSPGKVIFAGRFYDYGKMVAIDHGFDIKTRYAHLSKISVKKGDFIDKGQVIGKQGNTGRSTGHHLHYEIRYKDKPVDPKRFLRVGQKVF